MEQVWKGAALCLTGAVLAAVLKKKTPELALLLALAVVAVVAAVLIRVIDDIVTVMEHIMRLGNLPAELFGPLFKTVGIAMVSRLGSDLCRDAGKARWPRCLRYPVRWGPSWCHCHCLKRYGTCCSLCYEKDM